MIKKDRDLCRIWDVVCNDHPDKADWWRINKTLEFYSAETNDIASVPELLDALEVREDER